MLLLAALIAAGAAALLLVSAHASLTADSDALARVGLPLGGGKIESVTAVTGPHSRRIPIEIRGTQIWPRRLIATHERVLIDVVIKRPGWVAWLAGKTERLHLTLTTPSTRLRHHYLTLASGAPLRLQFEQPIRAISYGPIGHLRRHVLANPLSVITLDRTSAAGSIAVAAAPRSWESAKSSVVSWFPAGAATAAVASPTPGSTIGPTTPISLTFSKTVAQALGSHPPPLSPTGAGAWHVVNSHTIVFQPTGYGYGLGAKVTIGLPSGVRLVGANGGGGAAWSVPAGSTKRLQQLLSLLGYLPLHFSYAAHSGVLRTPEAQIAAATRPPRGTFHWRYGNVPSALRAMWQPGTPGTMTRGAIMAFENDHGMTPDGDAGPAVWKALIQAAVAGHASSFGYTFVTVSESSPESLSLWHNGQSLFSVPVNTGIASAPTATGTYPVYEHLSSGTMSGTNPDGSHYNDPGIPWISYFNGGDALHGFDRAQYGFPQSLGCVEMTASDAGRVWPYTPVGTLVHVV